MIVKLYILQRWLEHITENTWVRLVDGVYIIPAVSPEAGGQMVIMNQYNGVDGKGQVTREDKITICFETEEDKGSIWAVIAKLNYAEAKVLRNALDKMLDNYKIEEQVTEQLPAE